MRLLVKAPCFLVISLLYGGAVKGEVPSPLMPDDAWLLSNDVVETKSVVVYDDGSGVGIQTRVDDPTVVTTLTTSRPDYSIEIEPFSTPIETGRAEIVRYLANTNQSAARLKLALSEKRESSAGGSGRALR